MEEALYSPYRMCKQQTHFLKQTFTGTITPVDKRCEMLINLLINPVVFLCCWNCLGLWLLKQNKSGPNLARQAMERCPRLTTCKTLCSCPLMLFICHIMSSALNLKPFQLHLLTYDWHNKQDFQTAPFIFISVHLSSWPGKSKCHSLRIEHNCIVKMHMLA